MRNPISEIQHTPQYKGLKIINTIGIMMIGYLGIWLSQMTKDDLLAALTLKNLGLVLIQIGTLSIFYTLYSDGALTISILFFSISCQVSTKAAFQKLFLLVIHLFNGFKTVNKPLFERAKTYFYFTLLLPVCCASKKSYAFDFILSCEALIL